MSSKPSRKCIVKNGIVVNTVLVPEHLHELNGEPLVPENDPSIIREQPPAPRPVYVPMSRKPCREDTRLYGLRYSFCITCKGRAAHLKETLIHNADLLDAREDTELVILNYGDNSGLDELMKSSWPKLRAMLGRRIVYLRTANQPEFRVAHAKNIAHRAARGGHVVNLDADQFLTEDYLEALREVVESGANVSRFGDSKAVRGGGFGRIGFDNDLFQSLGGYNEQHHGYGREDIDILERAELLAAKVGLIDSGTASFIRHGDEERNISPGLTKSCEEAHWDSFFENSRKTDGAQANKNTIWGTARDIEFRAFDKISVVLTSFKRKANLQRIIQTLRQDEQVAHIALLDHGPEPDKELQGSVDEYTFSTRNDLMTRWLLASRLRSEYFSVQDDDLIVKDWAPLVGAADDDQMAGLFGVDFGDRYHGIYSKGRHMKDTVGQADILKGRTVVGKVARLRSALNMPHDTGVAWREDDIMAMGAINRFALTRTSVEELPEGAHAWCKKDGHMRHRDRAVQTGIYRRRPEAGVVFCTSPQFQPLLALAIPSLLNTNPGTPFYVHTFEETGFASRIHKLSCDLWSPFQHTLFLDCDVLVKENLTGLFDRLAQGDLHMCVEKAGYSTLGESLAHEWIHRNLEASYIQDLRELDPDTIHFNSGVMLFRKSQTVHNFFQAWRDRWAARGAKTMDQIPLMEVCQSRPAPMVLPPRYNCFRREEGAAIRHFLGGPLDIKLSRMRHEAGSAR